MKNILKYTCCLVALFLLLCSCSTKPLPEPEVKQPEVPKAVVTEIDIDAIKSAQSQQGGDGSQSTFPYIPKEFNPSEKYPSLYNLPGADDHTANNNTVGNVSFYLDETKLKPVETDNKDFFVFESIEGSDLGPFKISLYYEPITSLSYFQKNSDGEFQEVETLNVALDFFLQNNPGETYTYFSETIEGHYFPAAMFLTENGVGFFYYFSDGEYVYSMQFLSYDPQYAEVQKNTMCSIINSIDFPDDTK